jgi:hypothetical protein
VEELASAISRVAASDELVMHGLSTAYHQDLRLHREFPPSVPSVCFINLSLPVGQLENEMRNVRRYLPCVIFILYGTSGEIMALGRLLSPRQKDWLAHFFTLHKQDPGGGIFDQSVRAVLDQAKAATLKRSSTPRFFDAFISYSHSDARFARWLYEELRGWGVRVWLDEKQLRAGDRINTSVAQGIEQADKLLLCASRASLTSWWVDNEIGNAISKEQDLWRAKGRETSVLIPLDLDGYMFSAGWKSGWKTQITSRLAPKFEHLEKCPDGDHLPAWGPFAYLNQASFDNVLRALRKEPTDSNSDATSELKKKQARADAPGPLLHVQALRFGVGEARLEPLQASRQQRPIERAAAATVVHGHYDLRAD